MDKPMNGNAIAELGRTLHRYSELPYDQAWSMPSGFYTDPHVLQLEREQLFLKQWVCVGRADELPRRGDYMSSQVCGEPIVVIHGEDGEIRAFSNVCRHRGAVIADGRGNAKRLICPYHSWSYDTLGRLVGTPAIGERAGFDRSNCRLPEFACTVWHGFLFVCLAADPPALALQLAGLETLIRPYHMEDASLRYFAEETWDTNWKCFIENYMEGYHLTSLHRQTLHDVNPSRLCQHYPPGDGYFGYFAGFAPSLPRPQQGHPDLSAEQAATCVMFAVPPSLVVGCASDYSSFVAVQPEGVGRVRAKMGLCFYGQDWPKERVDWAIDLYRRTMAEDKSVLVGLMKGLNSRHHQVGPLAPADLEGPTWDFYRYLHRHLGPALAETAGAP